MASSGPRSALLRRLVPLIGAGVALSAGWWLWHSFAPRLDAEPLAPRATPAVAPERPAPVQTALVRKGSLPLVAEATGRLEPWRTVSVSAETGGRVVERSVDEGDSVAAGALLIRLDGRQHDIELAEARAEWLKLQAAYAVEYQEEGPRISEEARGPPDPAADELERIEHLAAEGLLSRSEAAAARREAEATSLLSGDHQDEVRAATSGLAQAEQRLEKARLVAQQTAIHAPFAGRVADLAVEVGQQVAAGQQLMVVLEDDRLKVDVQVLEADLVKLRPGARARVRIPALGEQILEGKVHTINPRLDPDNGTARVRVAVPNPGKRLVAGLFAYVELETGRLDDRLLVPTAAVLDRQGRSVVFRIVDGRALWTYVKTGARSGDWIEVREGVAVGDRVAVAGHFSLAHEAPVTIEAP